MTNPARALAENAPGDTSANTGAVRVAVSSAVTLAIVWLVERFTTADVDTDNAFVILAGGAIIGAAYRVYRLLAHRFPAIAWALFGIGDEPRYLHPNAIEVDAVRIENLYDALAGEQESDR